LFAAPSEIDLDQSAQYTLSLSMGRRRPEIVGATCRVQLKGWSLSQGAFVPLERETLATADALNPDHMSDLEQALAVIRSSRMAVIEVWQERAVTLVREEQHVLKAEIDAMIALLQNLTAKG
jgi:hypothetical protein